MFVIDCDISSFRLVLFRSIRQPPKANADKQDCKRLNMRSPATIHCSSGLNRLMRLPVDLHSCMPVCRTTTTASLSTQSTHSHTLYGRHSPRRTLSLQPKFTFVTVVRRSFGRAPPIHHQLQLYCNNCRARSLTHFRFRGIDLLYISPARLRSIFTFKH